jgi:hypothetical protein
MRRLIWVAALCAAPAFAQQGELVTTASGATLRALDKISGDLTDLELNQGDVRAFGRLTVSLTECRYPSDDPSSNAYAHLRVIDSSTGDLAFNGWMVAASPALNALDHPRYDVWVLRCNIS